METCSIVTPAAALLMQKGIGRYYLASDGRNFQDKLDQLITSHEHTHTEEIDPLLLPYMTTENMWMETTETRLTRMEKTALIADYPIAQKHLNVCCNYDAMEENCSVCAKCCRTLANLDLLGKTDAFGKVFNIGLYRKDAEKRFIAEVLTQYKEEPYYRSMVESAAKKQISLRDKTTFPRLVWAAFLDSPLHNVLRKFPGLRPAVRGLKRMLRSSHTGNTLKTCKIQ